jgi:translation elongation factor EF-Ts
MGRNSVENKNVAKSLPKKQQQEEKEEQEQPSKKITKIISGQIRKYYYLTTLKSMDDLDKFRLKVSYRTN